LISEATAGAGIAEGWLHLLETRADVEELLGLDDLVDLVIPRGSNEFVRYIMDRSRIPVLGHADGVCHCYIDAAADPKMAVAVAVDSKTQYVAVCNATETLLVHERIAAGLLPEIQKALTDRGVVLFGCEKTRNIIDAEPAAGDQWATEYLDLKLSVKVVQDADAAIDHINTWGSGHTDAIVTEDRETALRFLDRVDSGNVLWNCSTRFSDGFRYGLGAEVGISTNKIHARGPVGLEGLVIYKYKLIGAGQVVDDYASGRRRFTHRDLDETFPK
jgi:glutamate-5-semialdehyde dehydrogenase